MKRIIVFLGVILAMGLALPVNAEVTLKAKGTSASVSDSASVEPDLLTQFDGDTYGEVSGQDPHDLRWDAQERMYHFLCYLDPINGTVWPNGVPGTATFTVTLQGAGKPGKPYPTGTWVGDTAIEFVFPPCGVQRVILPIKSADGKEGWGYIQFSSPAYVGGNENGYKIDFADGGNARIAVNQ